MVNSKLLIFLFFAFLFLHRSSFSEAALPGPMPSGLISPTPTYSEQVNINEIHLQNWCTEASKAITSLKWKIEPCANIPWQIGGSSIEGRPLVYADFGDKNAENTTLVFAT